MRSWLTEFLKIAIVKRKKVKVVSLEYLYFYIFHVRMRMKDRGPEFFPL